MQMTRSSKVQRLWREHLRDTRCWVRGSEVSGIDLDLLDANTCQCVLTYLDAGTLSAWKTATLFRCVGDMDMALLVLEGEARDYFERLRDMARLVLVAASRRA